MKNLISILLVTIYVFGNTELGQVFNIPQLLKHYRQHAAADGKISFAKFITMHYCGDDGIRSDDDEDSKLPFKQIHLFSFIYYTKPVDQALPFNNCSIRCIKTTIGFANGYLPFVSPKQPLHPPRFIS